MCHLFGASFVPATHRFKLPEHYHLQRKSLTRIKKTTLIARINTFRVAKSAF